MLTEIDLIEATISPRTDPAEMAQGDRPSSEMAGGNDGKEPGEKSSQNAKVPGTDDQDQDVKEAIAALAKRDFKNREDWFKLAQIMKWIAGISDKEAEAREFLSKVSEAVREIASGRNATGKDEPDDDEPLKKKGKMGTADGGEPVKNDKAKPKPKGGDSKKSGEVEPGIQNKKEDLDPAGAIKCISDGIEGIKSVLDLLDEARKKGPKPPITGEDWRRIKEYADDITRNADRVVKAIKSKDASNVMEMAKKLVTDLEILVQRLVAQYPEAKDVAKYLEAAGRILLKLSMEDVGDEVDDIDLDRLSEALSVTEGADAKRMRKHRNKVAADFKKAGLDGNGRFRKPEEGYSKAVDILSDYGIELGEVVSGYTFKAPSGSTDIRLAWSNKEDPFSPQDIEDFMLHLSWHRLESGLYEVIAYLTL